MSAIAQPRIHLSDMSACLLLIGDGEGGQEGDEAADEGDDAPEDDRRVQRHEVLRPNSVAHLSILMNFLLLLDTVTTQ